MTWDKLGNVSCGFGISTLQGIFLAVFSHAKFGTSPGVPHLLVTQKKCLICICDPTALACDLNMLAFRA